MRYICRMRRCILHARGAITIPRVLLCTYASPEPARLHRPAKPFWCKHALESFSRIRWSVELLRLRCLAVTRLTQPEHEKQSGRPTNSNFGGSDGILLSTLLRSPRFVRVSVPLLCQAHEPTHESTTRHPSLREGYRRTTRDEDDPAQGGSS